MARMYNLRLKPAGRAVNKRKAPAPLEPGRIGRPIEKTTWQDVKLFGQCDGHTRPTTPVLPKQPQHALVDIWRGKARPM